MRRVVGVLSHPDRAEAIFSLEEVEAFKQIKLDGTLRFRVVDENGDMAAGPFDTREEAEEFAGLVNHSLRREAEEERAAAPAELVDRPFVEVMGDRDLFDQAIRAVTMSHDCDYLGAMERLQSWAHNARPMGGASLRDAIEWSPVDVTVFDRDLRGLGAEASFRDLEMRVADEADEDVDDVGRVRLSDPDERAKRLTDPVEFERSYQRHLDAAGAVGSEEGREAYRVEYRLLLDSGIDPVATLERRQRTAAADEHRLADERRSMAQVANETERRARQRELQERIADARAELDRL